MAKKEAENPRRSVDPTGAEERLDVRGLLCPIPILRTAQRMRGMVAGERLEVIGDDLGIVEDMPVWCEETSNRLVSLARDGEVVRCVIEKSR